MSNPELAKPSEATEAKLGELLANLRATSAQMDGIYNYIGRLREELNNSLMLLERLQNVIGPEAYTYSNHSYQGTTWHSQIDVRSKAIKLILEK